MHFQKYLLINARMNQQGLPSYGTTQKQLDEHVQGTRVSLRSSMWSYNLLVLSL